MRASTLAVDRDHVAADPEASSATLSHEGVPT
jgi:hypothetical protein